MDRFIIRKSKSSLSNASSLDGGAGLPSSANSSSTQSSSITTSGNNSSNQETADSSVQQLPAAKRQRTTTTSTEGGDPRTIISWNVNGLTTQLKKTWSEIEAFLKKEQPDVLCLQEVRMAAACAKGAKIGDGQLRRRKEAKMETAAEKKEWKLVEDTLIRACAGRYHIYWSLADSKYAGTAMLVRKPLKPSSVRYTLPCLAEASKEHQDPADPSCHPEGRIILAAFETFDLLATYAPNNGNTENSFERRATWDEALRQELRARAKPIVWIGDINIAPAWPDVSHPDWFLRQCYQGDPEDMRGQPGFTPGERARFRTLLEDCKLVDSYRHLHPATEPPPAGGPYYTWRGHPPVHQPVAKYHGKGMRIDLCLLHESLLPRLEDSAILGHSEGRIGFMGSDHCPIRATIAAAQAANVDSSGTTGAAATAAAEAQSFSASTADPAANGTTSCEGPVTASGDGDKVEGKGIGSPKATTTPFKFAKLEKIVESEHLDGSIIDLE